MDQSDIDYQIYTIITKKQATLEELHQVYSVDDVMDLMEILEIENDLEAAQEMDREAERKQQH